MYNDQKFSPTVAGISFALVQGIQPHENKAAAMRPGLGKHSIHALRLGSFRDRTAYHSLIGLSPGAQQGIIIL